MIVRKILMNETLPKKNFFRLNEVTILLDVKPYEIRFWEAEFPQIKSLKSANGQRLYRKEDVVLFSAIKHLLHDRKFTVAGARNVLGEADLMQQEISNNFDEENEALGQQEEELITTKAAVEDSYVEDKKTMANTDSEIDAEELMTEASLLLGEESSGDFCDKTQKLYQECGQELEKVKIDYEPEDGPKMLGEALLAHAQKQQTMPVLSKIEQEKALSLLLSSQNSLKEVLQSLEKIKPSDFWKDF